MVDRSDTWDGGYRRKAKNGKKVFVIYARRGGKLYEISTRATSSDAAAQHWRRFQTDPANYRPEGDAPREALRLDADLGFTFLVWSRDSKGNSARHLRDQKKALQWWQDRLGAIDLRAVKTDRILRELDGVKHGRKQLIATLKTFYGWLRKERHLITTAEDPMFGQIRAPVSKAAQLTRRKAIDRKTFLLALNALEGWPRDALEVLGSTGWHLTELERFARGGEIERHPHTGAPVILCPRTKGGNHLRTEIPPAVEPAATRLLEAGQAVEYFAFLRALRDVGATFNPGNLRHSVATWAINEGTDPALVSAFLNHRSLATTRKFYATHAVPAKVPTLTDSDHQVGDPP
jgi:hypothetical protein